MIMSLKQRKIKFEPRIKLNHNIADPERNAFWESKFAPLPLKNS